MYPRRLLAAVLLLLAGCGTETGTEAGAGSEPADAPVRTVDGEVQVGCGGGASWPPSVMAGGVPGLVEPEEVVEAFRALLADPAVSEELRLGFLSAGAEATEWRVLAGDGQALVLGLGSWTDEGPAEGARTFEMARSGSGWEWLGGGDCRSLEPVLVEEGVSWVELTGVTGTRDTDAPRVVLNERACTSGRDPGPFLKEPTVVEDDEAVTVYWVTTPPLGGSCPSNPSVERAVDLEAPLGGRALLDGSVWPPAPMPDA